MPFDRSHLRRTSRYFWWDEDFLDLMARRWRLPRRAAVLDVGAGAGHWSFALSRAIPDAEFTLVDVDEGALAPPSDGPLCSFRTGTSAHVGSVYALPFDGERFDVVTAQTLLIHVADPQAALREMVRVLRPGGLLILSEPHDLVNCARVDCRMIDEGPDKLIEHFAFWVRYHAGRSKLGMGDLNIAIRLPELVGYLGLEDIRAWQSDRMIVLRPPYRSPAEQAFGEDIAHPAAHFKATVEEAVRIAMAGGADKESARQYLADAARRAAERRVLFTTNELYQSWASGLQVVSARRTNADSSSAG